MTCYYCHIEASLVLNNRAMVCSLCNEIKGSLSLQDFATHAFISGQYSPERLKHLDMEVKSFIRLRREKSAQKMLTTKAANNTGWESQYTNLCIKATGKKPTKYPMAN